MPALKSVFGRPGVIAAVSTGDFPAQMRQAGARTIYWDMNLNNRVGLPTAPTAPETIVDRANRLYEFAATQMGCTTPWIVLNELFGSHLETPWSENNTIYRQNVLTLMKTLSERGAKPLLLLSTTPFTGTDAAADWWREVARYGDLVKESYFGAPSLYKRGPVLANRRLRVGFRRGIESLTSIGIPVRKIGIALGFQTARGTGGREGLQPSSAWFRVVKWQALAARQVARETGIAHVVSWGWGTYRADAVDPDKPRTACVYLWTRDPRLCDAPRVVGADLNTSLTEGQIVLPRGAQCVVGKRTITRAQLAALTKLTGDRDIAYSILLARLAESPFAAVPGKQVVAAERAVLAARFGRSAAAYRAALARVGGNVSLARGALADELRRMRLESRLRAPAASAAEISAFYTSYPDIRARVVEAKPAPWWLGRRTRGLALEPLAPRPLFSLKANKMAKVLDLDSTYRVKPHRRDAAARIRVPRAGAPGDRVGARGVRPARGLRALERRPPGGRAARGHVPA